MTAESARESAADVDFEVIDEGGAVIVTAPSDEIIIEHAEDTHDYGREPDLDRESGGVSEPDALTKLKAQYAERESEVQRLRREHAEAERRANANANIAAQGERNYREATVAAVDNAIALAKSNIAQAQAAMAAAASRNDWETHTRAVAILTENSSQIQSLEAAKRNVESAPQPDASQYQQPAQDNFETQIKAFPPKTQQWLREHRDDIYLKPDRAGLAEAAARTAQLKGIPVESEDYFDFIDEQMGYKTVTKEIDSGRQQRAAPAPRQAQTPAAPPARSTFGASQNGARRVQLTQDQRRAAAQLYADLPEHEALAKYARGVAEIDGGKSNLLWSRDKYKGGAGV
jgi:hypothetical protein